MLPDRTDSPVGLLADMFAMLARVFSDPEVKAAGDNFFRLVTKSVDRELDAAPQPTALERGAE